MTQLLFYRCTGATSSLATSLGDISTLHKTFRVFLLRDFSRCGFGQHVQSNFKVGHVVAQAFFLQALELLVFLCRKSTPLSCNNISQRSILNAFLHASALPFVSQCLTHLYRFNTLVNPRLGITQPTVIGDGLVNTQFRVLHLIDALSSHLRHPLLEWLGFGRRNRLDNTKYPLCI